jgi:predicted aldo/keto reductase-like oxidoreductase
MAYRMLSKIGLVEKRYLGGFYANLKVDPTRLPENLRYKDIISGEDKEATIDGLMDQGIQMGVKMIESAYDYYCSKISRQVCEKTIAGNNLDTGQIGKTKVDIKFSIDV